MERGSRREREQYIVVYNMNNLAFDQDGLPPAVVSPQLLLQLHNMVNHSSWRGVISNPEGFLDAVEGIEDFDWFLAGPDDFLGNASSAMLDEQPYAFFQLGTGDAILPRRDESIPPSPMLVNRMDLFAAATSPGRHGVGPCDHGDAPLEKPSDSGALPQQEPDLEPDLDELDQGEASDGGSVCTLFLPPPLPPPAASPPHLAAAAHCSQEYTVGGETIFIDLDELADLENPAELLPDDCDAMPLLLSESEEELTGFEADDNKNAAHYFEQVHQEQERTKKRRRRTRTKAPDVQLPPQPSHKLKHAANSRGLSSHCLKQMLVVGLPLVMINAFIFIEAMAPASSASRSDAAELFSGVGRVASAFNFNGHVGAQFDYERHPVYENILRPEGLLTCLRIIRDIKAQGLCHYATVCSSWIYLSRASTGRSSAFPEGDSRIRVTRSANCMAARVALLMILTYIFGVKVLHEQPLSSLMSASKYFEWLRNVLRSILGGDWFECVTWMGAYGHELQKPTQLLSTDSMVYAMKRSLTPEQRARCDASEGCHHLPCLDGSMRRRVIGAPKGLKASQEYPVAYGETVFQEWKKVRYNRPATIEIEDDMDVSSGDEDVPWSDWQQTSRLCAWPELRLDSLALLLNVPTDKLLP